MGSVLEMRKELMMAGQKGVTTVVMLGITSVVLTGTMTGYRLERLLVVLKVESKGKKMDAARDTQKA